jgi:hypothetical protein
MKPSVFNLKPSWFQKGKRHILGQDLLLNVVQEDNSQKLLVLFFHNRGATLGLIQDSGEVSNPLPDDVKNRYRLLSL